MLLWYICIHIYIYISMNMDVHIYTLYILYIHEMLNNFICWYLLLGKVIRDKSSEYYYNYSSTLFISAVHKFQHWYYSSSRSVILYYIKLPLWYDELFFSYIYHRLRFFFFFALWQKGALFYHVKKKEEHAVLSITNF